MSVNGLRVQRFMHPVSAVQSAAIASIFFMSLESVQTVGEYGAVHELFAERLPLDEAESANTPLLAPGVLDPDAAGVVATDENGVSAVGLRLLATDVRASVLREFVPLGRDVEPAKKTPEAVDRRLDVLDRKSVV